MSIERTPSGGYKVRVRMGSKATGYTFHTKSFKKGEHRLAKIYEQEFDRSKRLGTLSHLLDEHTVGEVAAEWWAAHGSQTAPRTRAEYHRHLRKHILPVLDGMKLREVGPVQIEVWMAELDTGPAAKKAALGVLNQVCNFAVRAGYLAGNPCLAAKRPKQAARKPKIPATPLQVEQIRKALFDKKRPGDAYLVSILAYAGMRPQETWWLKWDEIRDRSILARSAKTGQHRAIPMFGPLAADMAQWRLLSSRTDLAFPTSTGKQFNKALYDNWRKRVWDKVAPEELTPYSLRHGAISLWLRDPNISRMEAASWAGHGLDPQDRHYAHVVMEGQGSAEDAIRAARAEVFGEGTSQAAGGEN